MSRRGELSVQDIKGRFECLPDFPAKNNNVSASEHRRYQKRNGIKVSFPPERCRGVQKDEDQEGLLCEDNVSSRLRSLSVGTASPRGVCNGDNEKVDISKKKAVRNHSFNKVKQTQNGKLYYQDESGNASYNFSSFAEKQKLVENIVMNIRNNAKKSEEEEYKRKDSKTRDIFSITSKLEKDLKNVLEKGSRLKWNSKSNLNKSHFEDKVNDHSGKLDSSINSSRYEFTQSPYSESNDETGVKLLSPFRTYSNDALDTPDKENKFTGYRCRSSPDLLRKSNKDKARLKSSDESDDQLDCSQSSSSSQSKEESSQENSFFFYRSEETDFESQKLLRDSSPVRPPRRTKKKQAPLPPLPKNNCRESSYAKENFKDSYDGVNKREGKEHLLKETGNEHVVNKSSVFSQHEKIRNSLCEVNNEFNYEEQCEKSLEGDTFLHHKLTASISLDSSSSRFRSIDSSPPNKNNSSNNNKSEGNLQLDPLPMGSPPKKPPRTFAYDIYHSVKHERKKFETALSPPAKLTEEEIESLYSKPIKRLKDKSASPLASETSSQPEKINGKPPPAKPMIAPKPPDLINKSKKRLSAVEPLTQSHNDFADEKPSIKRNSSFRFSFKKNSKYTGPHLRQISPRRELKMGKKLKNVVRNFSPKRNLDTDKRVRFQSDYDDVLNDDSVVYATPVTNKAKTKESPQELHYMCSPLFEDKDNDDAVHHKENRPPSSPRGHSYRPGLMDGLREELRQSCRFVQKRLKSTPNGRRKYKTVSTPRH